MTLHICPNCGARIVLAFGVTDYIHDCGQNADASNAIKQEDILIVGNWEDYSGVGSKSAQMVLYQGLGNELFGSRADIEGENKDAVTIRGNRAGLYRQRNKHTYIEVKDG